MITLVVNQITHQDTGFTLWVESITVHAVDPGFAHWEIAPHSVFSVGTQVKDGTIGLPQLAPVWGKLEAQDLPWKSNNSAFQIRLMVSLAV